MTRVVILGGGFAGLSAARALDRRAELDVTVVNRDNYSLFTPMLHEVAASDIDLTHIVNPIRKRLRRSDLVVGEVRRIDTAARVVHVGGGHELPYDHLVLALGASTNFFGNAELERHALAMKTLNDAARLRNRLIASLEEADSRPREGLLTFVVAGGGFAGVETVAAANDFLREAVRHYPDLRPDMVRVVLVHAGEAVLPELDRSLGLYARRKLEERGVEVLLETRVRGYDGRTVELSDGREIVADTLVWTVGLAANDALQDLDVPREGGRIQVDATLQVSGHPDLWALGDCAWIPDPRTGQPYPPTAQHAIRQGRVLADNLLATLQGRPLKPFVFDTIGQLAALGRRAGVASVMGMNFSGFPAWWLWRTVYLSKLPGLEKKIRVALDWTLDLLFTKDLVQYGEALPAER